MRTFRLSYKDFLLTNKQVVLSIAISILFPILMYENLGANSELMLFLIVVIFSQYTLFNTISLLDNKYESEKMFLILPYKRLELVISKYIYLLSIFVILITATLIGSMLSELNFVSINAYLLILLVSSVFFGVLIPVQYYFGYEKTKYFSFVLIFSMPFLSTYIGKMFSDFNFLSKITQMDPMVLFVSMTLCILVINTVSITCSNIIFSRKDL